MAPATGKTVRLGGADIPVSATDTSLERLKADGKRIPRTSAIAPVVTALVVLPVWAAVLLPSALISQAVAKGVRAVTGSGKAAPSAAKASSSSPSVEPFPSRKPLAQRKYDLVLLGATGYTGGLAAKYLAKQYGYGGAVRWALAGRRAGALEKVRAEAAKHAGNDAVLNVPLITCDTSKPETLHALASDTRVVASTAGPFAKYGSSVVEFCARYGTSYADITGEADWVREMIDKYDDVARATGARIVPFDGHDSIPWDLSVEMLAREMRTSEKQELTAVEFVDELKGAPSGGTIDTIMMAIDSIGKEKQRYSFDPLLRTADGKASERRTKKALPVGVRFSKVGGGAWTAPFLMSYINVEVVKRSHALREGGAPSLRYTEAAGKPNWGTAFVETVGMLAFFTALLSPHFKYLLQNYVLPKPGQGPTEKQLDRGFLRITGVGTGTQGAKLESTIYFPTDAGYRDTARMLVESGLTLALEADRLPAGGGVFTPASCQGPVLLERLTRTGTSFNIRKLEAKL